MCVRAFIGLNVLMFKHLCLYYFHKKATYRFKENSLDQ